MTRTVRDRSREGKIGISKNIDEQVEETGQMIDSLTGLAQKAMRRMETILDRLDPQEMTVRDLRDIGYAFAVISDKRQLLMEQKATLEGTTEATRASIGKQLEGIAALKGELDRRRLVLEAQERKTVDVTEEGKIADEGSELFRERQGEAATTARAETASPTVAVGFEGGERPAHNNHPHGWTGRSTRRGRI